MAVQDGIGNPRPHAGDEPVAQARLARRLGRPALSRDAHGDPQAHDPRDVLRSGPPALLLTAAGLHRREPGPTADAERADTLGTLELVPVDREQDIRAHPGSGL